MAVRMSALRTGSPLPPGRFLVVASVRGLVDPRTTVRLKWLGQLEKNSNDLTGNRTRDLPDSSIVPHPTWTRGWNSKQELSEYKWEAFPVETSCADVVLQAYSYLRYDVRADHGRVRGPLGGRCVHPPSKGRWLPKLACGRDCWLQKLLDRKLTWKQQDVAGKNRAGMTPKTVYRVSYQCPFHGWEIPGGGG
jgi:hypothetical protein